MNFETMSNNQIIEFISKNLDQKRVSKKQTAAELANKGGCNKQTYSNFISKGTDIRLGTFIDILRGIDELENFQKLVEYKEPYSPLGNQTKPQKRVRKTNTPKENQIEWND